MPYTYYQFLNIDPKTNEGDIEKACKAMSDKWNNAEISKWATEQQREKCIVVMQCLNEVKEVLLNSKKKNLYDLFIQTDDQTLDEEFIVMYQGLDQARTRHKENMQSHQKITENLASNIGEFGKTFLAMAEKAEAMQKEIELISSAFEQKSKQLQMSLQERENENQELKEIIKNLQVQAKIDAQKNQVLRVENDLLKTLNTDLKQQLKAAQKSEMKMETQPNQQFEISKVDQTPPKMPVAPVVSSIGSPVFGSQSTKNSIQPNSDKRIQPTGLKAIYKIFCLQDSGLEYMKIRLVFENDNLAKNFENAISQYFRFSKETKNTANSNGGVVYNLELPINGPLFTKYCKEDVVKDYAELPRGTLQELQERVSIEEIPQEFRKYDQNEKITKDEVPEKYKIEYETYSKPQFKKT